MFRYLPRMISKERTEKEILMSEVKHANSIGQKDVALYLICRVVEKNPNDKGARHLMGEIALECEKSKLDQSSQVPKSNIEP
jgi:hypothetical protein